MMRNEMMHFNYGDLKNLGGFEGLNGEVEISE